MLKKSDYLKSYMRMNETEKLEYLAGVKTWTEETYPRLAALDDSWKETDMKDFDEGLKLASALQKAQGFLSTYMRYDAKRRLDVLNKLLSEVRIKSGMSKLSSRPVGDTRRFTAVIPPVAKKVDEEGVIQPAKPFVQPTVSERRPEHLSQYIDMLPAELKKESEGITSLYDQLAHWRGRAEYLVTDPRADKEMVARAAQKTVKIEEMILNFWARVDMAYEKATGKKVDADMEKELLDEAAALQKAEQKSPGDYTREDIEALTDEKEKEVRKRARIEANKKYLRRKDSQMTDERKEQFSLRLNELIAWGITPSANVLEIAKENNIDIPNLPNQEETPSTPSDSSVPSDSSAPSESSIPSTPLDSSDPLPSSNDSTSSSESSPSTTSSTAPTLFDTF